MLDDSDDALLRRYISARCPDAFRQLADRYGPMMRNVARRITGNWATSEDITQECLFELARRAGNVRGLLPAWMHRVAVNRSIDARRREETRQQSEYRAAAFRARASEVAAPADDWQVISRRLDEALDQLPEPHRHLLILHYYQDQSHREIAAILGVNASTVCRRLDRAIEALRAELRGVRRDRVLPMGVLLAQLYSVCSSAETTFSSTVAAKMSLAASVLPLRPVSPARRPFFLRRAAIAVCCAIGLAFVSKKLTVQPAAPHINEPSSPSFPGTAAARFAATEPAGILAEAIDSRKQFNEAAPDPAPHIEATLENDNSITKTRRARRQK